MENAVGYRAMGVKRLPIIDEISWYLVTKPMCIEPNHALAGSLPWGPGCAASASSLRRSCRPC